MPGMPSISQSAAFLIKEPTGNQEQRRKYVKPTAARSGMRHMKRKI
jgi:hypothetical protein